MKHCVRCDGFGRINSYSHVKAGTCFKCGGVATRTKEEIQAIKDKKIENNKKWIKKEKVLNQNEFKIKQLKDFIEALENNIFKNEEEKEINKKLIYKNRNKLEQLENELKEAQKGMIYQ